MARHFCVRLGNLRDELAAVNLAIHHCLDETILLQPPCVDAFKSMYSNRPSPQGTLTTTLLRYSDHLTQGVL